MPDIKSIDKNFANKEINEGLKYYNPCTNKYMV